MHRNGFLILLAFLQLNSFINPKEDTLRVAIDNLYIDQNGLKKVFVTILSNLDWVYDNGRDKIGEWIEQAAQKAGR